MSNVSMALLKVGESNRFSASRIAGSSAASVASFRDLVLHAAQRFHHASRAGAQKQGIVVHVQHPEPRLAPAHGGVRPGAVDAGGQASAYTGLQDRLDQASMLRVASRRIGLHAMGHGQIVGTDVDPIITGPTHQRSRERAGYDAPAADRRLAAFPELAQRHRLSRAPSLIPLTTLAGSSPSNTRVRLSRTTSSARASASAVAPPTCGDKKTLSIRRRG